MPAVVQSTVHLLEQELCKVRSALQEIRTNAVPVMRTLDNEVTIGAMAAHRKNLIDSAPDVIYGTWRLTAKDLGLISAVPEEHSSGEGLPLPQHGSIAEISGPQAVTLVDVLSNSLILDHMAPLLSISSLLALASTSRQLRAIVMDTPYVFRHVELSNCRGAQMVDMGPMDSGGQVWRSERMDESLTEDEFYSGPLRGIFASLERRSILQAVRTLVLDGLSVPADLIADIVLTDRYNVNILSIRECLHLNERKLMQVLQHAVRPTRPKGMPRVRGIYHFTQMNSAPTATRTKYRDWWSSRFAGSHSTSGTSSPRRSEAEDDASSEPKTKVTVHPQNEWFRPSGKLFKAAIEDGWAQTLKKCEGIIAFDAVLCRGPRHDVDRYTAANAQEPPPEDRMLPPAVATIALGPGGCDCCHTSPEGPAIWGRSPDEHFPLLSPPPLHSSIVTSARRPVLYPDAQPVLIARCADCLTDRWCHRCNKWFCLTCLPNPAQVKANLTPHQTAVKKARDDRARDAAASLKRKHLEPGVSKDCWECGPTCASCKMDCQRFCQSCQGVYCIEHNEGCSSTMCDWCNTSSRRRTRELY